LAAISWGTYANTYRTFVALQTAAWAFVSFGRASGKLPRAPDAYAAANYAVAVVAMLLICAGVVRRRMTRTHASPDVRRRGILQAWLLFQAASAVALVSYARSGVMLEFLAGITALAIMHAYTPNRIPTP
jgi:hypothetical protein